MKRIGSKSEVYFGYAKQTDKGYSREHLTISPKGNVVLKTSFKHVQGGSGLGTLFGLFNHRFPTAHPDMTIHRPPPAWLTKAS